MRLPGDSKTGRIARACLILSSTTALAACGALGGGSPSSMPVIGAAVPNGPQADYPVVIGAPYMVGDTQYTPADVLNYDEVGYVVAGEGEGITGGHHTLPYPSYVEVTSLDTGRTILVRLEQRGPMDSQHLISLSPAAMMQLEAAANTPVRVRRVNPPEEQRALLRSDEAAPLRMDTPMGLVEVLKRRLPAEGSASLRAENEMPQELEPVAPIAETELAEVAEVEELPPVAIVEPAVAPAEDAPIVQAVAEAPLETDSFDEAFAVIESSDPRPMRISGSQTASAPAATTEPAPSEPVITNGFVVQAAALSNRERAQGVASAIGGRVEQSGNFFRVRTGPFATRAQAEASLANVRAAGYTEARIFKDG